VIDKITFYQKKLRLSQSLIEIYHGIEFESKDQFVLKLLESLYIERQQRIIQRNLKAACFPMIKTLEEYSFAGIQFPERMGPDGLISLEFINRQENLILYGGVGTGKTHLSIALGVKAIENQKVVLFFTVHSLINRLVKAKEDDTYEKLMKKIAAADLIILDEWGYLPLHQDGARLLFEVVSLCYERKSVIITTNIEFSHWKNFLFDDKLTVAIIDRLIHHSHLLFYDRESYRKQHALIK
jgi:DNA replication protein DnaC